MYADTVVLPKLLPRILVDLWNKSLRLSARTFSFEVFNKVGVGRIASPMD